MLKRVDFRRVFILAGLAAQGITYAALWGRMIASPAERTGADFIAFFAAGRVAQTAGFSRAYDPALQQAVQEEQVGFPLVPGQVLLYNHVPYLLPVLSALVSPNYVASFARWALLLLALFAAATALLARHLQGQGWEPGRAWLAWAGMLTFFPLFVSLMNGQDTAFAVLGLCLWSTGVLTGRDRMAGLGLALTSVRPQLAALLAVPFLFRRQRVFGWFCAGAAGLGLVGLLAVGWGGLRDFLGLLSVSAGGEWYGMKEPEMLNLVGLLWRTVPGLGGAAIRWTGWGVYGLTLAGLCLSWWRSRRITEGHLALAATLAVFSSPHLHYHDLTFLLPALVLVVLGLEKGRLLEQGRAALVPLTVSLILLFSGFVPFLRYTLPYLVMLAMILLCGLPHRLLAWRPDASRT